MTGTVRFKKLRATAITPRYAHGSDEDAGMDLHASRDFAIASGGWSIIETGLAIELPPGTEGQVRSRSGLATRGVSVLNSPGTIDPGFRGEICVILINHGDELWRGRTGDRVAQLVICPYVRCQVEESGEMSETVRGAGGMGSTGV